jgi:hypothetical protein
LQHGNLSSRFCLFLNSFWLFDKTSLCNAWNGVSRCRICFFDCDRGVQKHDGADPIDFRVDMQMYILSVHSSLCVQENPAVDRGELSYLGPLGSEKISAPYFNQCFLSWGGGWYYPPG